MYIFNWLVTTGGFLINILKIFIKFLFKEGKSFLTRTFGVLLKERIKLIYKWAERQGLEQSCECHMDLIQQTVDLLITPKTNDQIASLGATCYKLNSIQVLINNKLYKLKKKHLGSLFIGKLYY